LPIFFSVADDDEFPPSVIATEWLYELAGDHEKKFVHLADGKHGAEMFTPHPELMDVIVDWYVTTLIKTPGHAPLPKNPPVLPKEVPTLDEIDLPGGAARISKRLAEARQKDPQAQMFPEDIVNFVGYEHMQTDPQGAIEILKLNAAAYADSPNAYDSLSDAYLADGQTDLARKNAERALEFLPSDTKDPEDRKNRIKTSAEDKLKQLRQNP
jgi:tetratricopeptide (TPR) repeat protein